MNYLDPYYFFFELPLYTSVEILQNNLSDFSKLVTFNGKIDAYNPILKEQTTFRARVFPRYGAEYTQPTYFEGVVKAELTCLRTNIVFEFYFLTFRETDEGNYFLQKIGQVPSIADLHISQIKDYNKVLSKEKLKEFTKAIGLAANGVGIGSFVYLRRIFESLIEEAHDNLKQNESWEEEPYQKCRMNEKIELLKSQLPEFLVEHKQLYGILSKGIHELEEQECLSHFLPVKTGIEMILDEKVIEFEKAQKRLKASNAIKNISNQIK